MLLILRLGVENLRIIIKKYFPVQKIKLILIFFTCERINLAKERLIFQKKSTNSTECSKNKKNLTTRN